MPTGTLMRCSWLATSLCLNRTRATECPCCLTVEFSVSPTIVSSHRYRQILDLCPELESVLCSPQGWNSVDVSIRKTSGHVPCASLVPPVSGQSQDWPWWVGIEKLVHLCVLAYSPPFGKNGTWDVPISSSSVHLFSYCRLSPLPFTVGELIHASVRPAVRWQNHHDYTGRWCGGGNRKEDLGSKQTASPKVLLEFFPEGYKFSGV